MAYTEFRPHGSSKSKRFVSSRPFYWVDPTSRSTRRSERSRSHRFVILNFLVFCLRGR